MKRLLKTLPVLLLLLTAAWGLAVLIVRRETAAAAWTPSERLPALEAPTADIISDVWLSHSVRLTPADVDVWRALSLRSGDPARALTTVTDYRRAAESLRK